LFRWLILLKSSGICENQICSTHGCFLENIDSQKFVCEKTEVIKILKSKNAEKLLAVSDTDQRMMEIIVFVLILG